MTVNPITSNVTNVAPNRTFLSREQFMKILISELKNQNPFEPMDNTDFMNQMIGLQTLDSSTKLIDSLTQFQQFLGLSSASSFIGKIITGKDEFGTTVEGIATSAILEQGNTFLVVDGKKIALKNIMEVTGV